MRPSSDTAHKQELMGLLELLGASRSFGQLEGTLQSNDQTPIRTKAVGAGLIWRGVFLLFPKIAASQQHHAIIV